MKKKSVSTEVLRLLVLLFLLVPAGMFWAEQILRAGNAVRRWIHRDCPEAFGFQFKAYYDSPYSVEIETKPHGDSLFKERTAL